MATFSGTGGNVKIGTFAVAEIDNWELTIADNLQKTTKFGQLWRTQVAGVREWSGKFGGRWDMTDTNGQLALQNSITGGTIIATLELDVSATHNYTGAAWLKQVQIKQMEEGIATVDFDFDGDGALSFV